jgi:hypothetical protein
MMTMNAPVCLAIALGIASGFTVFDSFGDKIRNIVFKNSQN